MKYRKIKIAAHLIFWLASYAFALITFEIVSEHKLSLSPDLLLKAFILNLGFALAVYSNYYLFIPRYLKKHSYIFYFFWIVVSLSLASLFITTSLSLIEKRNLTQQLFSINFFTTAAYVFITSLAKFLTDWIELQDINLRYHKSERQRLEAELNTLKAQINPHFLFNSLNNIYSLSLVNSDKTPQLILKLSDLMRHVLYESRENFISLKRELDFVTNFIELQHIRVSDRLKLNVNIPEQVPNKQIMPLTFEPFIDNAFKHGPRTSGDDAYITIAVTFDNDWLHCLVENSYNPALAPGKHSAQGVGLENVKQRLKLLYGANEYALKITQTDDYFRVNLELQLK